jgi:hypothetical protein
MIDKLIFGKDINKAIINYKIKQLFCSEFLYNKIKNVFPAEFLNFEITKVSCLKNNDIGNILEKNYNGAIGIKYY